MTDTRFVRCRECGAQNEPRAVFCSRCGASLPGPARGNPRPRFNRTSLALGAALLLGLLLLAFILYNTVARGIGGSADIAPYKDQQGIPASLHTTTTVGTDTPTTAAGTPAASTTTTEQPLMVRPKATVSSSALKGTATASFQATNLLDGDLTTAWIEGKKGAGLGEWVRFDFAQPTLLARIDIVNGYQKEETSFAANPRAKLVSVQFSSGATYLVELQDTQDLQFIVPAGEAIEWVKLVIVSVYPGKVNEDTALSEVHLYERVD
jgi:hypothetical protein